MDHCFFGHERPDTYEIDCWKCGEWFELCAECWQNGIKFICSEPDCGHINTLAERQLGSVNGD